MQRRTAVAFVLLWPAVSAMAGSAAPTPGVPPSGRIVIYHDHVEAGRLRGGRMTVDGHDPQVQAVLGLQRRRAQAAETWDVTTVIDNGPHENRIDLVILGDGYTAEQLPLYALHVEQVLASFFDEPPLDDYASYFNVHRVDVVSSESGVDEPDQGILVDTALNMSYNCFGIPHLLCVDVTLAQQAAALAPDADQILVLANSDRYGGAGYPDYHLGTLAGDNEFAIEIALHEFGHAFANLADEYDYQDQATYNGPELPEANVSIFNADEQDALQVKWFRWLDVPGVGSYQGARYYQFGIWRPTQDSKMRSLNRPFDEVNIEQFVRYIYAAVAPIDDATPDGDPLPHGTTFFASVMQPANQEMDIQWFVDGLPVAGADQPAFTPDYSMLAPGVHDVAVMVVDPTDRVRDPVIRDTLLTEQRAWQVAVSACPLDLDGDGIIDAGDLAMLLGTWGPHADYVPADFDGDGVVDATDLAALLGAWGPCE